MLVLPMCFLLVSHYFLSSLLSRSLIKLKHQQQYSAFDQKKKKKSSNIVQLEHSYW